MARGGAHLVAVERRLHQLADLLKHRLLRRRRRKHLRGCRGGGAGGLSVTAVEAQRRVSASRIVARAHKHKHTHTQHKHNQHTLSKPNECFCGAWLVREPGTTMSSPRPSRSPGAGRVRGGRLWRLLSGCRFAAAARSGTGPLLPPTGAAARARRRGSGRAGGNHQSSRPRALLAAPVVGNDVATGSPPPLPPPLAPSSSEGRLGRTRQNTRMLPLSSCAGGGVGGGHVGRGRRAAAMWADAKAGRARGAHRGSLVCRMRAQHALVSQAACRLRSDHGGASAGRGPGCRAGAHLDGVVQLAAYELRLKYAPLSVRQRVLHRLQLRLREGGRGGWWCIDLCDPL